MNVSESYYYSDSFIISPLINPGIAVDCDDYFLMDWSQVADANGYELSSLTGKTISPFIVVTDTLSKIDKLNHPEFHYAITPLFANNQRGIRSLAIDYTKQAAGCYINDFFVSLNSQGGAEIRLTIGSNYNFKKTTIYKRDSEGEIILAEFEDGLNLEFDLVDSQLKQGISFYRAIVELINGDLIQSEELAVYFIGDKEVLLFPNPVENGQDLNILTSEPDARFEILDEIGRPVFSKEIRGTEDIFTILKLQKGIYIYNLRNDDSLIHSGKLVVF